MVIKARNTSGILVEVDEFEFPTIGNSKIDFSKKNVDQYQFKDIKEESFRDQKIHSNVIKLERGYAKNTSFKIDPRVIFHRGLKAQEEEEINLQIKKEVRDRVKRIERKAYIKGSDEGKKNAFEESQNYLHEETNKQIKRFSEMVDSVISQKEEILKDQVQELYHTIKILVKWIILRELSEDGEYIKRLLEKLILDLGSRENLLIKVNEEKFSEMPVILELVQKKIGEFKNVRVERDLEGKNPGLIVESMNTIMDGSFESQMKNLDKIFSVVENHDE